MKECNQNGLVPLPFKVEVYETKVLFDALANCDQTNSLNMGYLYKGTQSPYSEENRARSA